MLNASHGGKSSVTFSGIQMRYEKSNDWDIWITPYSKDDSLCTLTNSNTKSEQIKGRHLLSFYSVIHNCLSELTACISRENNTESPYDLSFSMQEKKCNDDYFSNINK